MGSDEYNDDDDSRLDERALRLPFLLMTLGACSPDLVPATDLGGETATGTGDPDGYESSSGDGDGDDDGLATEDGASSAEDTDTGEDPGDDTAADDPDVPWEWPPLDIAYLIITVEPEHLVADPIRDLLYVTIGGDAGEHANELVIIDPHLAAVVDSIPMGSNPSSLALADDGSTLWIGLDGSHELARVDLETSPPSVDAIYPLPVGASGELTVAGPMVVLPGTSESVAVSLHQPNPDLSFSGVAILDHGVPRPTMTPGHTGAARLAGGPDGWLFGFDNLNADFGFYSLETVDVGPQQLEHASLVSGFGTDIVYAAERVYATSGEVVDVSGPASPSSAGKFPHAGAVLPQLELQRVLMLSPPEFEGDAVTMRELDPMTLAQLDANEYELRIKGVHDFTTGDGNMLVAIGDGYGWQGKDVVVLFPNPF